MPDEEKSFEKYLDSRLSNIETAIEHQTRELSIIAGTLKESVDRALVQSDIARKGLAGNNKWLIGSMFTVAVLFAGIVGLFAGMIYFIGTTSTNVRQNTIELSSFGKNITELGRGTFSVSRWLPVEMARIMKGLQEATRKSQKTEPEKLQ